VPWSIKLPGSFDVAHENGDVVGHAFIAGVANGRMSHIGFLDKRAKQAGKIAYLAIEDGGAKINVAQDTIAWIRCLVIIRGCEQAFGPFIPVKRSFKGQFFLALEVMEKTALCNPGCMANVIYSRGRV